MDVSTNTNQSPQRRLNKFFRFFLWGIFFFQVVSFFIFLMRFSNQNSVTSDRIVMALAFFLILFISFLLLRWIGASYVKFRKTSFVFAIIFFFLWILITLFALKVVFNSGMVIRYTVSPPDCPPGFGYTATLGPADGAIYSPCRLGPNKNRFPDFSGIPNAL